MPAEMSVSEGFGVLEKAAEADSMELTTEKEIEILNEGERDFGKSLPHNGQL